MPDTPHMDTTAPLYDRTFLLSPGKRIQVMALWEAQRYGLDSFGDADYVCLYGMAPAAWYARPRFSGTLAARAGLPTRARLITECASCHHPITVGTSDTVSHRSVVVCHFVTSPAVTGAERHPLRV
jgi:hypothetical protein